MPHPLRAGLSEPLCSYCGYSPAREWPVRPDRGCGRCGTSALVHAPARISADFRLAFTSGVSANETCFERELLDHYLLVFEKRQFSGEGAI